MSVVVSRIYNGYTISLGDAHLSDDDPADDYRLWIERPDGSSLVFAVELFGRESAAFRFAEGLINGDLEAAQQADEGTEVTA